VSVTFKPSAAGSRTAMLSINDNAANSPQTVSLSGTGTAASLSVTSLSFGAQLMGSSSLKTVRLTNLGSTPLRGCDFFDRARKPALKTKGLFAEKAL
jgi:hypothetical protein